MRGGGPRAGGGEAQVNSATGLGDLLEIVLLHSAGRYDLRQATERERSARELRRLFLALQRVIAPDVVLEIGAYGAELSLALAHEGFAAHAFEANSARHARCVAAVARSGLSVRYRHAAVGAVDGVVTFNSSADGAPERRAGANSLLRPLREALALAPETVPGVTLAGYLAEQGLAGRGFSAAISVAGGLGLFLDGAGQALDTCRAALVEVEDRAIWQDQMRAPEAVAAFLDRGLVPVARDFRRPAQYRVLFLAQEALRSGDVRLMLAEHLQRAG